MPDRAAPRPVEMEEEQRAPVMPFACTQAAASCSSEP